MVQLVALAASMAAAMAVTDLVASMVPVVVERPMCAKEAMRSRTELSLLAVEAAAARLILVSPLVQAERGATRPVLLVVMDLFPEA